VTHRESKSLPDLAPRATRVNLEPVRIRERVWVKVGDLTADLSGKRGQVTGTESTGGDLMAIKGLVPLSEVSSYQSRLRSVTGGQGAYTIEFSHYAPVPPQTQQELASQFKLEKEED